MDKKTIDNIVWYIPFKKLRNSLREYLTELVSLKNNQIDYKKIEDLIIKNLQLTREDELNILKNLDSYLKRGIFNQYTIRRVKSLIDSVDYLEKNDSKNIKLFESALPELDYILKNEIEKEGIFLEFGVFNGKSINFMSNILKDRKFYGFDSFEGLPEDWIPGFNKGRFSLDGNLPPVNKNVTLIKGWFNETLPQFIKELNEDIAFIHVDCDLYSSTKTIFDCLKDKITPGTVITFDEYFCYHNWEEHEFKAFQEFVKEKQVKYKYLSAGSLFGSCSIKILEIGQSSNM